MTDRPRSTSADPVAYGPQSSSGNPCNGNGYGDEVVRKLNALTSEFYARETASFSATRQAPWHGWEQAWNMVIAEEPTLASRPLVVLDLGCGNLRFERFLAEKTAAPLIAHGFDSCADLASKGLDALVSPISSDASSPAAPPSTGPINLPTVSFTELDIVESLLDDTFAERPPRGTCDLAVAFGLMHHLPAFNLRSRILQGLLDALRPGGFAIVSFWQFLNDERLVAKAAAVTTEGRTRHGLPPFAPGDYLLGWQDSPDVFRFCHHTTDEEIDGLLAVLSTGPTPFHETARFSADGKAGNLNRYIILQRR